MNDADEMVTACMILPHMCEYLCPLVGYTTDAQPVVRVSLPHVHFGEDINLHESIWTLLVGVSHVKVGHPQPPSCAVTTSGHVTLFLIKFRITVDKDGLTNPITQKLVNYSFHFLLSLVSYTGSDEGCVGHYHGHRSPVLPNHERGHTVPATLLLQLINVVHLLLCTYHFSCSVVTSAGNMLTIY